MADEPLKFGDELEGILEQALELLNKGETVVFIMEDMVSINDRFQAVLDWMKEHGNRMKRRYGPGCFMQTGVIYFVGDDTHEVPTRGVAVELDLQQYEEELVRNTGLDARLRAKGL